jgi:hypothetical protein
VANEQLVEFAAAVTRGDVLQAEVTNLEAELALLRAENMTLTTLVAEQQGDIEDLENGVMARSRVPEAAAKVLAEVVAEEHGAGEEVEDGGDYLMPYRPAIDPSRCSPRRVRGSIVVSYPG